MPEGIRAFRFPAFVILTILFSPCLRAAPGIQIDTEYYDVTGSDLQAIHRSLEQHGPVGDKGRRFHARTTWKLNWSYRWIASTKQCRLTQTSVETDIVYLMPRLSDTNTLNPAQKQQWQIYYDALFRHEQQHKDYGVEAARELDRALKSITPKTCDQLESTVQAVADEVLDKYQKLERQFDLDTDHGRKQGVVLNIPRQP